VRVVSVTSIAVERDSRTYKMAASIARLGCESIVVEGKPSRALPEDLPFRLVSPPAQDGEPTAQVGSAPEPPQVAAESSAPTPLLVRLGQWLPESVADPLRRAWRPFYRTVVRRTWGTIRYGLWGAVRYRLWPAVRDPVYVLGFNLRDLRRRNRETGALLPEAEVYWLHSYPQFPSVARKARRQRARLFYDSPDAYWEPGQSPGATRAQRLLLRSWEALEARAVRRAERFTSVSEGVAGLLERRFGRRPLVIRNSHDLRLDQPSDEDVRSAAGLGPEQFLFVMTGNLKPGMTVREALLALQRLPDHVHLALVGRRHEQSRELVAELGLTERAHLLPPVPPMQVVGFIRTADASPILYRAATSNYLYALPNGFFHAIAAGLPILYPPLPEIRAVAVEHELGIEIDPTDPASIAAAAVRLVEDPEATARYRAKVERARDALSWEHDERLIAEVLGVSSARPGAPRGP
jgi:glycosyltransferase involved in cell wall biosynthesis